MYTNNIVIVMLILVIVFLIGFNLKTCNSNKALLGLQNALNDTLVVYKTKDGKNAATISNLTVFNRNQLLQIESQEKEIQRLQKLAKENKKGVVYITNTVETFVTDTLYILNDSTLHYSDEWVYLNVNSNNTFNLKVNNSFSYVIEEKKKPFKPTTYTITSINENPYTITTGLRSATIKHKNKRFGIGVNAGYGYTLGGFSPYIGIGVNYNLVELF